MPSNNLSGLRGKVALVTGASTGGLAQYSAVALAEHGADVFLADLEDRVGDPKEVLAAIEAAG